MDHLSLVLADLLLLLTLKVLMVLDMDQVAVHQKLMVVMQLWPVGMGRKGW
ncbi:hypothetical protein Q7170_004653 [Escherichia coli]|nr:hypothetical protein [Escherichia coli]